MKDITLNKMIIDLADEWDDLKDSEKSNIACEIAGVRKMSFFMNMIDFIKKSIKTELIKLDDETESYKFISQITMRDLAKKLSLPIEYVVKMIEQITLYSDNTNLFLRKEDEINEFDDLITWIYSIWDNLNEKEMRFVCSVLVTLNEAAVTYLGCNNVEIDANSLYQALENMMNGKSNLEYYIAIGEMARVWKEAEDFRPHRGNINMLARTIDYLCKFRTMIGENENGK